MVFVAKYFGKKLKAAIKSKGMSQETFAEKMGVKPATVSRWCTGEHMIEDHRLPEIFKILGVTESYFLGTEEQGGPLMDRLVSIAKGLPEPLLETLIQVAESLANAAVAPAARKTSKRA